jgi:CRISPR-associated protein Cmr2
VKQYLQVSIGPVQSFVSQSRRTRDLWSSSYLLSFLAAHAISGARHAGGTIVRPRVDGDPMLEWVEGRRTGTPPSLGSVPNQFTVELPKGESPERVAAEAEKSFDAAWQKVCRAVRDRFVAHALPVGNGTEVIWERQIHGLWELVWVAGASDDHGLLARRKRWRTHWLPEEPGDKCWLMPDFQDLSGHVRATDRGRQDGFWNAIRSRLRVLDLEDNERLSAVALVKRLYPRVAAAALGWHLDVAHWPSTVDIAALPWCQRVLAAAAKVGNDFACAVSAVHEDALTGGVSSLVDEVPPGAERFVRLNADWFHRPFVSSPKLAPLSDESARPRLIQQLEALAEVEGAAGPLGAPPVYFALLLADGDRLGRMVASLRSDIVSGALAEFTRAVPNIVRAHRGVTVYAGGDDVLALLPLDGALQCARDLERRYREAFAAAAASSGKDPAATLSAAVVFAHTHAPLNLVLKEAHRLLDAVAKDENGRASLAAGVFRGNGPAVQWVTTWERVSKDRPQRDAVECVLAAVQALVSGGLSSSLLQDVRRTLGLLCGASSPTPGGFAKLAPEVDTVALLRADIEHRLAHQDGARDATDTVGLALLLDNLLRRSRAGEDASPYVGLDGLLLASFLAGGGREEEHLP